MGTVFGNYDRAEAFRASDAPLLVIDTDLVIRDVNPAYLKVTRPGGTVCGVLASADGGLLRLRVDGVHDLAAIPLTAVTNLAVTPACP